MDDAIANFVGITGASEDAARQVIEICAGNLEQAIQLWFTDEELQRNLSNPSSVPPASSSSAPPPARLPTRRTVGREDSNGVIHIDSDDDDVPMGADDDDFTGFDDSTAAAQAANVARTAQEEEDAAIAKRLQEELFSGNAMGEDDVRAPMGRTTETLVAPGGFDDAGDINSVVLDEFRRRQQMRARNHNHNPFGQSIWDDHSNPAHPSPSFPSATGATGAPVTRQARLAELFRPPYDIMSDLPWDDVRTEGKEEKKWIIVNLQDMSDFNCQALNRDIWKDEPIKQLVRENFIFLQYDKNDGRSEQYINFYFPNQTHENPNNYPHVSIIDPRTGEQVKVWSGIPFPNALEFHAQLAEFLDRYSLAANSKNPVVKAKRPERQVDVDRMTEEEMLEMALQNSLEANGSSSMPNVHDPDELTKSIDMGSAKGKEVAEAQDTGASASQSAFAKIPSDKPHTEPDNNPATTTRIQFRHATGRVIRRFSLDDPVSRIYEWLKAAPLDGKEGVEFELKVMPQGRDLIEDLGKTVAEAGLKQGTVMIEFIED